MEPTRRKICAAGDLLPGHAVLFAGCVRGEERPCFVARPPEGSGAPVAFLNVCAHRNQPVATGAPPFNEKGELECRAHGAVYDLTGTCRGGPCVGAHLVPVEIVEEEGALWAIDDDLFDDSLYAQEG
jgi:nitrite reductase/ring-hydroxylating ferredoxin subunit